MNRHGVPPASLGDEPAAQVSCQRPGSCFGVVDGACGTALGPQPHRFERPARKWFVPPSGRVRG
ncbi:hypothetical protein SZ55_0652 [Pseudomonas sp. FeS53a]|nr:hypothetical protein SZ55_0652 [Pseudomonas sp. FeS53a]